MRTQLFENKRKVLTNSTKTNIVNYANKFKLMVLNAEPNENT